MPSVLLSGSAGSGKSQEARRLLAAASQPAVVVDFQEILASLLLQRRDPETGRYPARRIQDSYALPLAEYGRLALLTGAMAQEIDIIATNSDGDADRRAFLLSRLGPTASEVVIDPGRQVVIDRLTVEGTLDPQCLQAINRWYGRIPGGL